MATVVDEVLVRVRADNAQLASGLRQSEAMVAQSTSRMNRTSSVGSGLSPRGLRGALGGFGLLGAGAFIEGATERWVTRLREAEKVLRSNADGLTKFSAAMRAIPGIGSFYGAGENAGNWLTGLLGRNTSIPIGMGLRYLGISQQGMFDPKDAEALAKVRVVIAETIELEQHRARVMAAANDEERKQLEIVFDFMQNVKALDRITASLDPASAGYNELADLVVELQKLMHERMQGEIANISKATSVKVGTDEFQTPFGTFRVNQRAGDFRQDAPKEDTQKKVEKNTHDTAEEVRRVGRTLEGFTVVGFH